MTTTTTMTARVDGLHNKVADLEEAVAAEVINADTSLYVALLAIVGRANAFFLGKPGLAKSMLIDRLRMRVDVANFKKQLSPFTLDNEVLGPKSITGLKADRDYRITAGYLPTAYWAVLDELFNANSAILNALQEMILEGTWHNDGSTQRVPLNVVFGMSNKLPGDDRDDLAAFYDRFVLRCEVPHDVSHDFVLDLLDLPPLDPNPPIMLTEADIDAIQADAATIPITDEAKEAVASLVHDLNEEGMWISPRRIATSVRVMRAAAWLDGASKVEPTHVESLANVLWDRPDQRPVVQRAAMMVCNPHHSGVLTLVDQFVDLRRQVDALVDEKNSGDGKVDTNACADVISKLATAAVSVIRTENDGVTGQAAMILAQFRKDLTAASLDVLAVMSMDPMPEYLWSKAADLIAAGR